MENNRAPVCKLWQRGRCLYGQNCQFQHSDHVSSKSPSPPASLLLAPASPSATERKHETPQVPLSEACGGRMPPPLPPSHFGVALPAERSVNEEDARAAVEDVGVWTPSFDRGPPSLFSNSNSLAASDYQLTPPAAAGNPYPSLSVDGEMGAQKRMSNGEAKAPIGPHPSTIRVSAQYQTQAEIERKLQQAGSDAQERSLAEAKEDSLRLQGVQWIDLVRRKLQLPIRTYTTACTYFHKFRLAHPPGTTTGDGYLWNDAAAASLLTACKMEDTLKKSREILAASYNLKVNAAHEQLAADDPMFEQPSRVVIGLERLVLEAATFDFRNRAPHQILSKIAGTLGKNEDTKEVHALAWTALSDLYRTFAPLKQSSATLALATLELSARLLEHSEVIAVIQQCRLEKWHTSRGEIMETMLDSLDLYIQHTTSSVLGSRYTLDDFLRLRLQLNKECNDTGIPRHTTAPLPEIPTAKVQNGHPTPVSPPSAETAQPPQPATMLQHAPPVAGGTLRFMLNPHLAKTERDTVESYFKEEWEEYEEEIEVPLPRSERKPGPPSSRASSHDRRSDGRREERIRPPRAIDERRERDRLREREREYEREYERERQRPRDRDRDRRYDDRRRYDERDRYDERRYRDDRRQRDDRRYRDERR